MNRRTLLKSIASLPVVGMFMGANNKSNALELIPNNLALPDFGDHSDTVQRLRALAKHSSEVRKIEQLGGFETYAKMLDQIPDDRIAVEYIFACSLTWYRYNDFHDFWDRSHQPYKWISLCDIQLKKWNERLKNLYGLPDEFKPIKHPKYEYYKGFKSQDFDMNFGKIRICGTMPLPVNYYYRFGYVTKENGMIYHSTTSSVYYNEWCGRNSVPNDDQPPIKMRRLVDVNFI